MTEVPAVVAVTVPEPATEAAALSEDHVPPVVAEARMAEPPTQ